MALSPRNGDHSPSGEIVAMDRTPGGDERYKLEWPSRDFASLQDLLDAAPSGATIEVQAGSYAFPEPLFIRNKELVLSGEGIEDGSREHLTHFHGVPPSPIDFDGTRVSPTVEAIDGVINLIAARVTVQDLKISGGDAAIMVRTDAFGSSQPVTVQDVAVSGSGRGIVSTAGATLHLEDVRIEGSGWHGISVAPQVFDPTSSLIVEGAVEILEGVGVGIYFVNTFAIITDAFVSGCQSGGIVGVGSKAIIKDNLLVGNRRAGIALISAKEIPLVDGNEVYDTLPRLGDNRFGDAIVIMLSEVNVFDNVAQNSARAALSCFGGTGHLRDNTFTCQIFDIDAETYLGNPVVLDDWGGNSCPDCSNVPGLCTQVSSSIEPPVPSVPIE
jgi:hypothetical protein